MIGEHATEQQIQAYVDGLIDKDFATLSEHIETCEECRQTMQEYRSLFAELGDDTEFELPADFARTVAAQVVLGARKEERWSVSEILGILGPALMIAVTLYIVGLGSLVPKSVGMGQSVMSQVGGTIEGAAAYLQRFGLRADLLLFAVLALGVTSILDPLMRTLRRGKAMIMA